MKHITHTLSMVIILCCLQLNAPPSVDAREIIHLTLDKSIEIALENSYRIKMLKMGVERNRLWLRARQASLKSRVYMNLQAPQLSSESEFEWDSNLQKDVIVKQNTTRWQMDLAVRQPVILMGYPTNGYLSLNYKTYKYIQRDGIDHVNYYNRYYIKYEQPFFLPNELKNDIEDAELDLEDRELDYLSDLMWLMDTTADDYYDLFEYTSYDTIYERQIGNLKMVSEIAVNFASVDSSRTFDTIQVRMEQANTREERLNNQTEMRRQEADSKQKLRLSVADSVFVTPDFEFTPVRIDDIKAIEYGFNLNPQLRMRHISKRKNEIDVSDAKGWDAFNVTVEMTYGLEKQDEHYQALMEEFDKSYSTSVNMYVPIWDWGRRRSWIEAQQYDLEISNLRIEERENWIEGQVSVALENVREYESRTKSMMDGMNIVQDLTDRSIALYRNGNISLQDLLAIVSRQKDTEMNFIAAYLGYKRSLISLMQLTYYDFENDISLIDRFRE
jgi:hypothetical protein